MRKFGLALLTALLGVGAAHGQSRYLDPVFTDVTVTSGIQYGSNVPYNSLDEQQLVFDLYEPTGDNETRRPVIILIHSGSFLSPQLVEGIGARQPWARTTDLWIVELATRMAKKGYVVVSMDHRLGWDPTNPESDVRKRTIMSAVWRSMQDFKALVRFLKKDAAGDNVYKIDPDRIAAGGSSSGAYVSIHAEYLDKNFELTLPKFLDNEGNPLIDTLDLGNFDGVKAGRPQGSSLDAADLSIDPSIRTILSFGGAVADLELVEAGDPVVIGVHGAKDKTTPYGTAVVVTSIGAVPIIEVSGGGDLLPRSSELGNQQPLADAGFGGDMLAPGFYGFTNAGFEPFNWWNPPSTAVDTATAYLDTLEQFITPRLLPAMELTVSRKDADLLAGSYSIYPNPANATLTVRVDDASVVVNSIALFNLLGQSEAVRVSRKGSAYVLETDKLAPGIYFLQLDTNKGKSSRKIVVSH